MASNDPFVIEAEVRIQRYGTIEKVKALVTKEANDLIKVNPDYVFGQTNRKHELYIVSRPEDHYGRPHFNGKVCALVDSRDIPNHARIMMRHEPKKLETVEDVIRARSQIGRQLYSREAEVEMHKAIPLFDIMQSIYRDITMPFTITSDLGLRRDRTPGKNFSTTCFHFPMSLIRGAHERVERGDIPAPSLQTEVTYCDYEKGYDESNMFHTLSTQNITPPEGNGINTKILTSIGDNLNKFVEMNGGFSRVTTTDDGMSHPALIGFIPYSEVQYIRISLVMSGSN